MTASIVTSAASSAASYYSGGLAGGGGAGDGGASFAFGGATPRSPTAAPNYLSQAGQTLTSASDYMNSYNQPDTGYTPDAAALYAASDAGRAGSTY